MPNARRFLDAEYWHEDRCLLIHQGGQFYRWDGTCWPAIEDPILRSELYKWFEEKTYVEGDKQKPFAPTVRKVADLMDATRAITIINTNMPTPAWLTSGDHPADEIISCDNGLVHWPTRTLYQHRPGYYVHHSVPFAFDPEAPGPRRWLAFLKELWGVDNDTIGAVQEMFGYLISGDTRQQKMFLLVGPKRGGKGTIARVLTRMIGRHNVAGPTLASLGTNFGLQDLIGKPVAVISDARIGAKSDASLIAERLLSVSGEDLQNVDRKYLPPWSGYLPTRFVILTNELPRFTDSSGALASRFMVLMLTQSFYGRENPALTEELCAELPGIFNWALDGLQKLRARGRFQQPQSSRDAIQELEDLASPVSAFIRDKCRKGADEEIAVDTLYQAYRRWCEDNGRPASNSATFGRDLRASCPGVRVVRHRPSRDRFYNGLALGTRGTDDDDDEVSIASTGDKHRSADGGNGLVVVDDDAPEPGSFEPEEFDGLRDMPDHLRRRGAA
jgi:putative DNA primase/helicase